MRPLIGITLDWQQSGSFSERPHYALREHYFKAVREAGGLPVAIPLCLESQAEYLERIHGLIVPGGDYPSPGWWYGDERECEHHPRPEADVALIRLALKLNKPLLGICAGMQTLAVATEGRLHWRLADTLQNSGHRNVPLEQDAHAIHVEEGSLLHRITGQAHLMVNSHHNEGVATVGQQAKISALAPDGVIEAIEVPGAKFALGVQWHPEMNTAPGHSDRLLFEGLVQAAAKTF